MALYLLNRDDDRFKSLPEYQRDLYWHFPFIPMGKDSYLKIPKPFEVGAIFGSMPERMLESAVKEDPTIALDRIGWIINQMFRIDLTPQLFKPVDQVRRNWSDFRNEPIVPDWLQRVEPSEQYDERTPYLAREVGGALNYSPKKIEALVNGYLGAWGTYLFAATDEVLTVLGGYPAKGHYQHIWEYPVVTRLMEPNTPRSTRQQQEFYKLLDEMNTLHYTINRLQAVGEIDRARNYIGQNRNYKAIRDQLNRMNELVQKLNKQARFVQRSKTMSREDKAKRLDDINRLKQNIFKKVDQLKPYAEGK